MEKKIFCVIGSPIEHSLSPAIHNALFKIYGLENECEYTKFLVTPDTLENFIKDIPKNNICGFNITMPLKYPVSAYTNIKDTTVSTNTVAVRGGKLYGYSTDEEGFYMSIKEKNCDYKDKNVVFIGAGAVTSQIAPHAKKMGAKSITILNRTLANSKKIADKIGAAADEIFYTQPNSAIEKCDILINTTPLGMQGCPQFESFEFMKNLSKNALVCDLIYKPDKTRFLQIAENNGNPIQNGLSMLIWQAFFAFEKFVGIMPTKEDKQKVLQVLKKQNLI